MRRGHEASRNPARTRADLRPLHVEPILWCLSGTEVQVAESLLCQLAFITCDNQVRFLSWTVQSRLHRPRSRHRAARRWTRGPKTFGRAPAATSSGRLAPQGPLELDRTAPSAAPTPRQFAAISMAAGPRAPWLGGPPPAARDRGGAQGRPAACDRGYVVARARHRHGRRGPGYPDRVAPGGVARAAADRPRQAPRRWVSIGRIVPKFHGDLLEATVVAQHMLAGEVEGIRVPDSALDVLAQQIRGGCSG